MPSFDAAQMQSDAAPGVDAQTALQVRPGVGIGSIALGQTYQDLRSEHGELEQLTPFNRLVFGKLPALGVEVMLASAEQSAPSDDAIVIAVGLRAADDVLVAGDVLPGMARDAVEAALGVAPESVGSIDYYPAGISVEYSSDDLVKRVGVFAAYELAPMPPPMKPAAP